METHRYSGDLHWNKSSRPNVFPCRAAPVAELWPLGSPPVRSSDQAPGVCNPLLFGFAAMPREEYGRHLKCRAIPPAIELAGFLTEDLWSGFAG
jgi:hypothetical protein